MSKESIKLSRRDFLKTSISLGASGLVAACKPETPAKTIEKVTIVTRVMERVVERLVTATPLPPEEIEPTIPPTVFEPTPLPPTATVEVKPTVKSTPEVKPEATPTAVAYDVTREVEEEFNKRNGEAEVAFSIRVGMLDIWPERMSEKIGDFASFEVDPKTTPLNLGEKTRVLVDPENKKARVNLIPWYPEEDKEEVLGLFTPLLPKKLNSWEIDYLITQKVEEEEERLHLAAYDNTLIVPFITPGTIDQENWDKVLTLQAAGRMANIITAIEGDEGEKERPVIIFLDHQGEELLRAGLKTVALEEKETVRLEIENGQYTFFAENGQEIPEKAIKLWEVPQEPIPEKPEAMLELEGFTSTWNPETQRWEYVDVDGKAIAYWDQKIELVEETKELDFEKHRSLFTPWTAKQTEAGFIEAWNKGEIKTAIGLETSQGKIVEKISGKGNSLLCLADIPPGIILVAPFRGEVVKFGSEVNAGFDLIWDASSCQDISENCNNPTLGIYFKSFEDFIGPTGKVEAGTPLLRISDKRLTEFARGRYREYQIVIAASEADWDRAYPLTFENLLKEEKGSFVYISQ